MDDKNGTLKNFFKSLRRGNANNKKETKISNTPESNKPPSQFQSSNRTARKSKKANSDKIKTYALIASINNRPTQSRTVTKGNKTANYERSLELKSFLAALRPPDRSMLENHLKGRNETLKFKSVNLNNTDPIDIYIGLDFGTAFTKVVIGENTYKYILEFSTDNVLLPSCLWIDQHGQCYLHQQQGTKPYDDLKMPLLNQVSTEVDRSLIVAFIALVFVECRAWFCKSIYSKKQPTWFINCGLPTKSTGTEEIRAAYSEIILASWVLSFCESISFQNAAHLLKLEDKETSIPKHALLSVEEQINLFPEFIAQLTGYARSPSRRPYAHVLIDVGAGTLDVVAFSIKTVDDKAIYIVVKEVVENLGVEILRRYRHHHTKNSCEVADENFKTAVNDIVAKIFRELKRGAPNLEKVTVMLCGGGKSEHLYQDALKPVATNFSMEQIEIARIENLRGPEEVIGNQYHRFSVAAGLCDDPLNIAALQREELEPITNHQRSERVERLIQINRSESYRS